MTSLINLPDKIRDFLQSEDIGIAQVGADLLCVTVDKRLWEVYLSNLLHFEFTFNILNDSIEIKQRFEKWHTRNVTIFTGPGGMKMFKDALEEKIKRDVDE